MVTKYKLGYDPVEVDPEDMVRTHLQMRVCRCASAVPSVLVVRGPAMLGSSCGRQGGRHCIATCAA